MTEREIAKLLRKRVVALTGAGISVASGLRTFRGEGGHYEGLNPYELATPEAFGRQPVTVWNWYLERMHQAKDARPNPAHKALAELEGIAERLSVITSNVDPLHQAAGSRRVFRLHGNLFESKCIDCAKVQKIDRQALPERYAQESLPRCECGALRRPNVVWFGERPWPEAIEAINQELPRADIVLEVGQSGVVSYGFSDAAVRLGKPVVWINPDEDSPAAPVIHIQQQAEIALPRLVARAKD